MTITFAERIKTARQSMGLTQRQLARAIGIDYTYISKIENDANEYAPKIEVVRALAEALDLPVSEVVQSAGIVPDATLKQISCIYAARGDEFLDLIEKMFEELE